MALSDLITELRNIANDAPDSKLIIAEQQGYDVSLPVNGVNTTFRLRQVPISGTPFYTIVGTGAVFRSQTGLSVTDAANGIITITPAPNPGSATGSGLWIDYAYNWFSDAKYTEFLNQGSENLLLDTNPVAPTSVTNGLIPAMMQFALAHFFRARAALYADRYSSSGGEAGQSIQSVAIAMTRLADQAQKNGVSLRDDYWKRQGQRLAPAYSTPLVHPAPGFDPIHPPR